MGKAGEWFIGQVLPYEPPRDIIGADLPEPAWYALTVPPQREAAARDMLTLRGVHAQFPVREVTHAKRGKKIVRKLPIISRVVYAQFKAAPQWDVLKARKLITGVYGYDDQPMKIPYDVVRAVMGLPTVAEELEAARRELLRVREGDKAEICDGPLSGFVVDIRKVSHGRVWFETLTGIKGEADVSGVIRREQV